MTHDELQAWWAQNKDLPRGRFAADARRKMDPEQVERARAEFLAEQHEDSHDNAFELWLVYRLDQLLSLALQVPVADLRKAIEGWMLEAAAGAAPAPAVEAVSHVDVEPLVAPAPVAVVEADPEVSIEVDDDPYDDAAPAPAAES